MRAGDCRFFNGIQHDACDAGVNYRALGDGSRPGMALRLPCLPKADKRGETVAACAKFVALTEEEQAASDADLAKTWAAIEAGLSPCCQAPLDESAVVTSGRFQGSGWRCCSACGKRVFHGLATAEP